MVMSYFALEHQKQYRDKMKSGKYVLHDGLANMILSSRELPSIEEKIPYAVLAFSDDRYAFYLDALNRLERRVSQEKEARKYESEW